MLISKFPLFTFKNSLNQNDKHINYQFMKKAGLIRKINTGIFTWLPLSIKVIDKIIIIINNIFNKINGIKLLLPILQPIEYINQSNFLSINKDIFTLFDRNKHKYILSPTNEKIITKLIHFEKYNINNYPLILYQFQNKFRDEIRPRYGTIRSREFIMNDAYSFHNNKKCLKKTYKLIINCYYKFFSLLNLKVYKIKAYSDNIGGILSHEFHIMSKYGEDEIIIYKNNNISRQLSSCYTKNNYKHLIIKPIKLINNIKKKKNNNILYTFLIKGKNKKIIILLLPINRKINLIKLKNIKKYIDYPITFINIKEYQIITNHKLNFINQKFLGPIGLKNISLVIIDESISKNKNYIIGANKENYYYSYFNIYKDIFFPIKILDIKLSNNGDYLDKNYLYKINIKKSLEIAHIFQLEKKYSIKYDNIKHLFMGCYGIGITRLISAIIDQNTKNYKSLIWPRSISPFNILILPIDMYNNLKVYNITQNIYKKLLLFKIDVLLDDRKTTPGIMFNDMDLIGIPDVLIISNRTLLNNNIEYLDRKKNISLKINISKIISFIINKINKN